ncbi:MAG: prepilin-type N-terminal cleavage/methylation domain-containing protein [Patescibacteria group bacterium]
MNHVVKKQQGFTLIELMLAMTFIAVLLLAIAMTIIQVGAIYNKGTTLRDINQTSRDISDDLRRSISAAGIIKPSKDYILTPTADPAGGRFCLGQFSYVWNYEKAIKDPAYEDELTRYETPPTGSVPTEALRFVRVPDGEKDYCKVDTDGSVLYQDIRGADVLQAQELLKKGDHELGIHQFTLVSPVPTTAIEPITERQLYTVNFTLGTGRISALNDTQTACLGPEDPNSDALYCNIQSFSLVVRAGK